MEMLPDIDVSQNRIADAEHAKIACCIFYKHKCHRLLKIQEYGIRRTNH